MHTTHLVGHAEQEVAVVVRVSKQAEARQKEEEGERGHVTAPPLFRKRTLAAGQLRRNLQEFKVGGPLRGG
jgi:hypothetical protein